MKILKPKVKEAFKGKNKLTKQETKKAKLNKELYPYQKAWVYILFEKNGVLTVIETNDLSELNKYKSENILLTVEDFEEIYAKVQEETFYKITKDSYVDCVYEKLKEKEQIFLEKQKEQEYVSLMSNVSPDANKKIDAYLQDWGKRYKISLLEAFKGIIEERDVIFPKMKQKYYDIYLKKKESGDKWGMQQAWDKYHMYRFHSKHSRAIQYQKYLYDLAPAVSYGKDDVKLNNYVKEQIRISKEILIKEIVSAGGKIKSVKKLTIENGDLVGLFDCEKGLISTKTFTAGGHNIQVLHLRHKVTLLKKGK